MKCMEVLVFLSFMTYSQCLPATSVNNVRNPVWKIQTLAECEAENKTFCFTGMYSDEGNRYQINRFVSSNAKVLKHFETYRMTHADLTSMHRRISNLSNVTDLPALHRPKRDAMLNDSVLNLNFTMASDGQVEPHVDCSSVCCVTEDMTPPFSHIKENDGWDQVASTPEFPQRVSFYTETCEKTQSPCAGVQAMDASLTPRCVQFYRHHAIAVFSRTTGLTFRYIEVPVTCKCVLAPQGQDVSPISPSVAILKILEDSISS